MLIGIPKEIKNHEYRVGASPAMVRALIEAGHCVLVERNAGKAIGFLDSHYQAAGAQIAPSPQEIYACEMVIKVKEPQIAEYPLLREGLILFCYLHLAPDPEQTDALLKSKVIAIAYETVTDKSGRLPLLVPMSEIAGRISIQVGATYLQMNQGGKGVLLGGVPGVLPAKVGVIGGGIVGTEAARMALGLGADVTIIDRDLARLRELNLLFGPCLRTVFASSQSIEDVIVNSDLVIGAVLIPGKVAPKLITRAMLRKMEPGSVFVDVAIDQGGCAETSRPTSHDDPVYKEEEVTHYCVTNMPGACAKTSTIALTNATLGYALEIANKGWKQSLIENPHLAAGLNVCLGNVTNYPVAVDLGYSYVAPQEFLTS
jgi:alanine dehydrogenase